MLTEYSKQVGAYVRLRGRPYLTTCRGQRAVNGWGLPSVGNTCRHAPNRPILSFRGAKFPKMRDFLPRTPLNNATKFDAASFIRNRTNTHKITNKQTVTDICTSCLSACVDNNNYCSNA